MALIGDEAKVFVKLSPLILDNPIGGVGSRTVNIVGQEVVDIVKVGSVGREVSLNIHKGKCLRGSESIDIELLRGEVDLLGLRLDTVLHHIEVGEPGPYFEGNRSSHGYPCARA